MAYETTNTSAKGWAPDVVSFAPSDAVPSALILEATTVSGELTADASQLLVPYVDDASAQVSAEAALIPDSDPDLDQVVVNSSKITQLIRLSAEQWGQTDVSAQLSASASRAIVKKSDQLLINQAAPTAPAVAPSTGLLQSAGVDGGEIGGSLDGLIDLEAELAAAGALLTHVIVDPLAWAELRKLKTATGSNQSLVGAGVTDAQRLLLSLPVVVTNSLPAYTGLLLDKSSVVSAVGQVKLSTSEHAAFANDAVLLKVTWRTGHTVVRPSRLGKFTVTEPEA